MKINFPINLFPFKIITPTINIAYENLLVNIYRYSVEKHNIPNEIHAVKNGCLYTGELGIFFVCLRQQ